MQSRVFYSIPVRSGSFYSHTHRRNTVMKHHPRRTDEEWKELIRQCRTSGLSDYLWCRQNGMPSSSFYRAVCRLRIKACEKTAVAAPHQDVVAVHYEELKDTRKASGETSIPLSPHQGTIRLRVSDVSLELTNSADPALVDAVIRSLRCQC